MNNNKPQFSIDFERQYKIDHSNDFLYTEESSIRFKTIIYYFAQHQSFYKSPILNSKISTPSFNKGLLVIGNYGTGKSSILKTLSRLDNYLFKFHTALEVTLDYENINTPSEKSAFYKKFSSGNRLFDDILTEDFANNYGQKNVFRELLEIRCAKKAKTFLTCNYNPSYGCNLEEGLLQFRTKYGGRVYDRLFEMFNILEFKGVSMRR